jgi:hypothetical protein
MASSQLAVAADLGFLHGSTRGGSKGPLVAQKLQAAVATAPRTHGDLQLCENLRKIDLLGTPGL